MLPLSITEPIDRVLADRTKQIPQLINDLQQTALVKWNARGREQDPIAFIEIKNNLLHKITEEFEFTWQSLRDIIKTNPSNYSRTLENDIRVYLNNQDYLKQLIDAAIRKLGKDKKEIYQNSKSVQSVTLDDEIDVMKNEIYLKIAQFKSEIKTAYWKMIGKHCGIIAPIIGVISFAILRYIFK